MAKTSGCSAVHSSDDFAGAIDAVDAAAMAGGGVERAVGRLRHAPDHRLVGGEDGIHLGRQRKPAFAAERDALKRPWTKSVYEFISQAVVPLRPDAGREQRGQSRGIAAGASKWRMKPIIP